MSENHLYLLQVHGYKLQPSGAEKFKADFVVSDFAFTTEEAAENFIPEWKQILTGEQGFIEQSRFQLQIQIKQVRLIEDKSAYDQHSKRKSSQALFLIADLKNSL